MYFIKVTKKIIKYKQTFDIYIYIYIGSSVVKLGQASWAQDRTTPTKRYGLRAIHKGGQKKKPISFSIHPTVQIQRRSYTTLSQEKKSVKERKLRKWSRVQRKYKGLTAWVGLSKHTPAVRSDKSSYQSIK